MALKMLESGFASCSGRNDHNRMASASRMPITSRKVPASRIQTLKKNVVFSFTRIHNHTTENGKQDAQDYHGLSPFV